MRTLYNSLMVIFCLTTSLLPAQGWEHLTDGIGRTYSAVLADNGSYIVAGVTVNGLQGPTVNNGEFGTFFMKFNQEGDLIWTHFYLDSGFSITNDYLLGPLPNETFLVRDSDEVNIDGADYLKRKLVCFDFDGVKKWEFAPWPGVALKEVLRGVVINSDGSISMLSSLNENLFIIRIDQNGTELGRNALVTQYGKYGSQLIANTSGGLYHISKDTTTNHLIVYETDLSGVLINTLEYPNIQFEHGIELTSSGDFIYAELLAGSTVFVQHKINAVTGQVSSDTIYNGEAFVRYDEVRLSDGLMLVGSTVPDNPEFGIQLVRTDFDGNVIWEKVIDHRVGAQVGYSIIEAHDDGYLILGAHEAEGFGQPYVVKIDANGDIFSNAVSGTVAIDSLADCVLDDNDHHVVEDWIVTAIKGDDIFMTTTDVNGHYLLPIDSGAFTISLQEPNLYWSPCANDFSVNFMNFDTATTFDFPLNAIVECPAMNVDGTAAAIRPCFERPSFISYCNYGTITAENAYIDIFYDPFISLVSASIPYIDLGGNVYRFELGDMAPLECGDFQVSLFLDCDATVGAAYCIEAQAFPNELCGVDSSGWSGAFIEVDGTCETNDVNFSIKNIGDSDMTSHSDYVIIEDAILMMTDSVELASQEVFEIPFPANGSTYTIWAEQVAGAPGQSYPMAVVESCGDDGSGGVSVGFVNQFPFDDGNPYFDVDCPIATDSYDPNDKQGFPIGYGMEHKILPETPIEYLIRFQNTGSDTAFTVFIKDTLSEDLDISTFALGTSSHEVEMELSGRGILKFNFPGIELPDSNVNELGSNGFITFKIKPKKDTPLGTVIRNKAGIYFDFNDPVITNETFHTIAIDFPEVLVSSIKHPELENIQIKILPNPAIDVVQIAIENHSADRYEFLLLDAQGKVVLQKNFFEPNLSFHRNDLPAGIYFFKVSAKDGFQSAGKVTFK